MAEAKSRPKDTSGPTSLKKPRLSEEPLIDPAYIKYVKMAVAMAIIRGRPKGLSGKQYAERLCGKYQRSQLLWEERAHRLEEEVILLAQKCIQKELPPKTEEESISAAQGSPAVSLAQTSEVPTDGNQSGVDSKEDAPSLIPATGNKSATHLAQHASFLRSVLTLRSLDASPKIAQGEIEHITIATIKAAVKILESWLSDKKRHWMISDEMIDSVIALLCQLACQEMPSRVHDTVVASSMSLAQTLIMALMADQDLGNSLDQARLSTMVSSLSKCPHYRLSVVELLVACVVHFSDTLRCPEVTDKVGAMGDQDLLPWRYENIGHAFTVLEDIINHELKLRPTNTTTGSSARCFTGEFCTSVYQRLDHCLRNLSARHPLFAHAVWRVEGLLDLLRIKHNW